MKTKFSFIFVALFISSTNFAMLVKLPDAKVINARLDMFQYFARTTKIVHDLANQEMYVQGVCMAVNSAICEYNITELPEREKLRVLNNKSMIYEAFLKDFPEALEEAAQFEKEFDEVEIDQEDSELIQQCMNELKAKKQCLGKPKR